MPSGYQNLGGSVQREPWNLLAGMEPTCASRGHQTTEMTHPAHIMFCRDTILGEGGSKAWYQPEGAMSPGKKLHTTMTTCQPTTQETGARGWDCLLP